MKKTLLIISTILLGVSASAQITITTADVAVPTAIIYQAHDTMPTATIGAAGASATYDMSMLANMYEDTLTFLPNSAAPNPNFPTANLLVKQGWQAAYGYAVNNAVSLTVLGNAGTVSILGTPTDVLQINTPAETLAEFPETYLDNFTNNYTYRAPAFYFGQTIMGFQVDSIRTHGEVQKSVDVDGWGTLTTPLGMYDVIRAHETTYKYDSTDAYIVPFPGFGLWTPNIRTTADTTEKYTYWANAIGFTLVTATMDNMTGNVKSVDWLQSLPISTVGVHSVSTADNSISEYPNPAQNEINIVGNTNEERTITLYDIAGRLVGTYAITTDKTTINTAAFADGMYSYKVSAKDGSILKQGKVTINNK